MWSTTAGGTQEEDWARRRSKALLGWGGGGAKGGGEGPYRNIFLWAHTDCQRAGYRWQHFLSGISMMGCSLVWPTSGGGKPPQPSQTPELDVACHHEGSRNRHHWQPRSPQRSAQRKALQPSTTCCCSQSPGDAHTLLLPLPSVPGATYTWLRVTITCHGPAMRSILCHLPMGP